MNKFPLCCITFLLLVVAGALGQDVRYKFDSTANFSKFKTYKWVTIMSEAPIDKLTDEQVTAAVEAGLARKGLTKVDSDNADLFIGYQTTEHISEKFANFAAGWGPGPDWVAAGWAMGAGTANGKSSDIYKGELAVDMYNPANQRLIWRGVASKSLDPKASPEKRQKNLQKAVTKLMKDYPPPVK